jgi:hypothetical protein
MAQSIPYQRSALSTRAGSGLVATGYIASPASLAAADSGAGSGVVLDTEL